MFIACWYVAVISIQELHGGQEIFDSYGKKCNSKFFTNYGFAVEDNTGKYSFPCTCRLVLVIRNR
jgi:hypothetical protein